jgi:hypothetical protein
MKKVTITKETFETKFQANDGTLFDNENECKIYEQSYIGILKSKYIDIPKKRIFEYDFLFFGGCEDYLLEIVDVRNDDDIDVLLKLCLYFNSHIRENEINIKEAREKLEKAKNNKIIIGRGQCYNSIDVIDSEDFSILTPFNEWIERLKSLSQETTDEK